MELCYLKFMFVFVSSDIYIMKFPDLFRYVQYWYAAGRCHHFVIIFTNSEKKRNSMSQ